MTSSANQHWYNISQWISTMIPMTKIAEDFFDTDLIKKTKRKRRSCSSQVLYRAPKTWFCLVYRSEAAWHFGWAFVQSCRSFLCSSASQCWRYQLRSSEMHVVCRDFLFVVVLTNSSRLLEPYRLYNKGQVLLILSLETLSSKCCGKEARERTSTKTWRSLIKDDDGLWQDQKGYQA